MLPAGDQDEVELTFYLILVLYNTCCKESSAAEDGRIYRPKRVELIEIINKIIIVASSWLFILLYRSEFCAVDNEKTVLHSVRNLLKWHGTIRKFMFFVIYV